MQAQTHIHILHNKVGDDDVDNNFISEETTVVDLCNMQLSNRSWGMVHLIIKFKKYFQKYGRCMLTCQGISFNEAHKKAIINFAFPE